MSKEWDAVAFYTRTVSINGGPGLTINEALRALAAEARRRALMEAADIQRERSIERHGWDKHGDAEAIERAIGALATT